MKKPLLFTMIIVLASLSAQAQMKVQNDGHISLGTLSGSWNVGTQVYPSGTVHFNHQSTEDWKWVTVASPNAVKGKCWIVTYPGNKYDHRFFVTGEGYIFKRGSWRAADASLLSSSETIRDAGAVLDSITGVGSLNGSVIVPSNTDVSMRANDFIQIDGEFEIPVGSQMTLSVHECPLQNNVVSE